MSRRHHCALRKAGCPQLQGGVKYSTIAIRAKTGTSLALTCLYHRSNFAVPNRVTVSVSVAAACSKRETQADVDAARWRLRAALWAAALLAAVVPLEACAAGPSDGRPAATALTAPTTTSRMPDFPSAAVITEAYHRWANWACGGLIDVCESADVVPLSALKVTNISCRSFPSRTRCRFSLAEYNTTKTCVGYFIAPNQQGNLGWATEAQDRKHKVFRPNIRCGPAQQ